jgi:hypothetical protein
VITKCVLQLKESRKQTAKAETGKNASSSCNS